jgi:DnaJ-class molecular chaperone
MSRQVRKEKCPICGGSGQVSFFKGVSRFLLSVEECEACSGTGFLQPETDRKKGDGEPQKFKKKKKH